MTSRHARLSRGLTKDTRLRLADAVHIETRGPLVQLDASGATLECPRSILALLAFYEGTHSVEDGWRFLGASAPGSAGLAQAFARLMTLVDAGILEAEDCQPAVRAIPPGGAFGPSVQIRMLDDRQRTSRYVQAIRRAVRPGDVVVDVGTGSGVLALAAASAGAARVYAIESQPIADVAERLFQGSGFGDRITLLRGLSTELVLPEKADVMVSELIGNEPFAERIVETTRDAVARFVKPGARLVPSTLRVYATAVEVPQALRQKVFFTAELLGRWQRWYGLPLACLEESGRGFEPTMVQPWDARSWTTLAEPSLLHEIQLSAPPPSLDREVGQLFAQAGELGGFLVHFEADLGGGVAISTQASRVTRRNHWRSPLWVLREPRPVLCGQGVTLRAQVRNGKIDLALGELSTPG